ncbi:acyltransferase [Mesorhizobium sp. SARCC-RB16n]|nr:acyltransferase [Mesorhizobium sp. SARCC-RB16n]
MHDNTALFDHRLDFLDALRGFASVWVVMVHVAMLPSPRLQLPPFINVIVTNGVMGVELFFVVSTFSLCLSMIGHGEERRPVLGFALRRIFRIAPLFYVMIAVAFIRNFSGTVIDTTTVLLNFSFLFNLVPGYQPSIVPAGWTVGVETLFYVIFPLVYRCVDGMLSSVVMLLLSLAVSSIFFHIIGMLVSNPGTYHLFSIFYRAPIFMFGFIAFYALSILKARDDARLIGCVLLAIVPVLFFAINAGKTSFIENYYWEGAMFAALTVGLALVRVKAIVNDISTFLGRISYSIYLVHTPIIVMLIPSMRLVQTHVPNLIVAYLICLGATLALVVPTATLSYRLVERPANRWGKRWASRIADRPPPAKLVSAT